MKIHVWVPDFSGAMGGIQTFSRFLVRGLKECHDNIELSVFAKNDISAPEAKDRAIARFYSLGIWSPWQRTPAFTLKLLQSAARERPDLIVVAHVNFVPVADWLKRVYGIPFIVIGHGIEVWSKPARHVGAALRNATKVLAVSNFTRARMAEVLLLPIEKIELLPNTFQPEKFVPAPKPRFLLKRYSLRRDQPVILTIARLASAERYKGYDQILRALPPIREQFSDVRYILGGRGPDRARVASLVTQYQLEKNVILAGYIPEHELSAHYNLCDVFAMPSKGEGFGIVFLEALSCGKRVVAGNKDGSVDAVLNGKAGSLIDPDNPEEIADTIIQILSVRDSAEVIEEGQRVRREAINAYGYPRFVERLREIVDTIMAKTPPRIESVAGQ